MDFRESRPAHLAVPQPALKLTACAAARPCCSSARALFTI